MELSLKQSNTPKAEKAIEYLFYLLVLLYFVGKVFKPITLVIDIIFIYQLYKNKEFTLAFYQKYKKLIIAFGVFIGYMFFQSLFLELKYLTFKSSFETILYIILVFAALYNFTTKDKIKKLIYTSYSILFFLALDSFYQYFTGVDFFGYKIFDNGQRLTAWYDVPKINLMMGQFFGLLIASIYIFEGSKRKLAIFIFIISVILFVFAGNRSPILALLSSFIIVGFLGFKYFKKQILIIFFGLLLLFTLIIQLNDSTKKSYTAFLELNTSKATSGRYELFYVGFEMFKDNLWFGIGSNNYKHLFYDYLDNIDKYDVDSNYIEIYKRIPPNQVHSVAIDIIISYGLIGVVFLIYIFYVIFVLFIKNNKIGILSSAGFLYTITPFQFGRSFTMGDWQFITYLGLIFLVVLSLYNSFNENGERFEK